ncbi:MAG: glycosyltransferase family 29 protein [Sphingobium sp.]
MKGAPGRLSRKQYLLLYQQGQFEDAALALRKALRATPKDSQLMLQVAGLSRFGLLPFDEALPLLRKCIAKAPPVTARQAAIYLANLLWERKGAGAAMECLPLLIQQEEESPHLLLRAAAIAHEAGETRQAFDLLTRIGRDNPAVLSSMGYLDLILAAADGGVAELPQAERARRIFGHLSRFTGRFAHMIERSADDIAIVANGPSLRGRSLGRTIDSHRLVVRFNNHAASPESVDQGEKTNIWVRPAEFVHVPMRDMPADGLIILTGCNIRYRYSNGLQLLEPYVEQNLPIELVPRGLYTRLFSILDASPSAGMIGLAWTQEILGRKLSPTQVFGYSLNRNTSAVSHYHGEHHTGSWPSRHNWQAEHSLFQSLTNEVISA